MFLVCSCHLVLFFNFFFFSSRRRHTREASDWSSDVCSSDLEQSDKSDAVNAEDGHVMGDIDGVRNAGKRGIGLWLNPQIVMAGRDTGDHDRVVPLAFGPRTIAAITGVVAYLAAEVPGLPGILIDE